MKHHVPWRHTNEACVICVVFTLSMILFLTTGCSTLSSINTTAKRMVRMLSLEESKDFLGEALNQPTAQDVVRLIHDNYGPSFPKAAFFQPNNNK